MKCYNERLQLGANSREGLRLLTKCAANIKTTVNTGEQSSQSTRHWFLDPLLRQRDLNEKSDKQRLRMLCLPANFRPSERERPTPNQMQQLYLIYDKPEVITHIRIRKLQWADHVYRLDSWIRWIPPYLKAGKKAGNRLWNHETNEELDWQRQLHVTWLRYPTAKNGYRRFCRFIEKGPSN